MGLGVVSSPLLQRLQQMLLQLVLIEQAVSRLFSICKCVAKAIAKRPQSAAVGDHQQQGGPGIAVIFDPGE